MLYYVVHLKSHLFMKIGQNIGQSRNGPVEFMMMFMDYRICISEKST